MAMLIEILGTRCAKCLELEDNIGKALENLKKTGDVKQVVDASRLIEYGVLSTPALIFDGELKASGRVLSVEEVEDILGNLPKPD